jgi:hypothetical protein
MKGKSRPSKHELAAQKIGLNLNDPYELIEFLASAFINAKCKGINVNGLSNSMTIDAVYATTGIQLNHSNLSNYKMRNVDLTLQVAKRLNVPVLRSAHCDISYTNQSLLIRPNKNGASNAFHRLLDTATGESIQSLYEIWQYRGQNVGDKRNWVHSDVVVWCQNNNVTPMIPISHDKPTALRRIYKYLKILIQEAIIDRPTHLTLNAWINECLITYGNSDLTGTTHHITKWLKGHSILSEIRYVKRVEADSRYPPYIYCKLQGDICKFGKSESALRFKGSDVGMVICIQRHGDLTAYKIEQQIIKKLKERNVHSKEGTNEQFEAPLQHLCNVILDICATTPCIKSIVRSIVATTKHIK